MRPTGGVTAKVVLEAFAPVLAKEVRDDGIRGTTPIQGGAKGAGNGSSDWVGVPQPGAAAIDLWSETGLIVQA